MFSLFSTAFSACWISLQAMSDRNFFLFSAHYISVNFYWDREAAPAPIPLCPTPGVEHRLFCSFTGALLDSVGLNSLSSSLSVQAWFLFSSLTYYWNFWWKWNGQTYLWGNFRNGCPVSVFSVRCWCGGKCSAKRCLECVSWKLFTGIMWPY